MMTSGLLIRTFIIYFLVVFLMQSQTTAFKFLAFRSVTHLAITRVAILRTTMEVCRSQALRKGRNFVEPNILTEESLAAACFSSASGKGFKRSINKINGRNAWVDVRRVASAKYHFDDESFLAGRDLITKGVLAVKASVKQQNYEAAREMLGEALHTLQDFYSHSNWIEMGNRRPYSNLIKPSSPIDNVADSATCRSCTGNNCTGNILEEINTQQKLTSGYFGFTKPKGKCSHGGFPDLSSLKDPKGGINKDALDSSHGYLHTQAAEVAIAATRELLEDIRAAVGDSEFLRLMGFSQTSVLCFVIDTTGSMADDIAEVRRVTSFIIDSKASSANQPSEYILVPFNDPYYGPVTRTTNPDVFKKKIGALLAHDGGDAPEMCLSGLQLALTGSPPQTEIFVFTDADAKDVGLRSTILALIERTKSAVTFMLTNALTVRLNRRDSDQRQLFRQMSNPLNQLYQDIAQASGGQAIEVTKATLPQATSIIVDTSSSSLVTIFQAVRKPVKAETFSFFVDSFLRNLTIYITGHSPYYVITSPSGVSQSSAESKGALGLIQRVGNFQTVRPNISDQRGEWSISINSTQSYTIKVFGQSEVDFLFDFVELSDGPHPSYAVLNSRPTANSNITLMVSMVGGNSVRPTKVALVEASSFKAFNGTLEEVAIGLFLVTIKSVPAGQFVVSVTGEGGSSVFKRQSSTQLQASTIKVTTQSDETLQPGKSFTLSFTVSSISSGGDFRIRVSNDRGFVMTDVPSSLTLERGGSVNSSVILIPPANTTSGTDVTLTIEAEAADGTDSNYAVLRLAVVDPVTDITPPVCETVSIYANCSYNCSLSSWSLSLNVTERNGSGIQSVTVGRGNGTLSISNVLHSGMNISQAFYTASCCSPEVELVVVDAVGNVGTCFKSVAPTNSTNNAACSQFMHVSVFFWLNVGTILLFQFT